MANPARNCYSKSMPVSLRKIAEADTPLLVKWRNENKQFFPPQPDWTLESHLEWFREKYQADPSDNMFMVLLDGKPIGCIAMTIRNGEGELERMILGEKELARGGKMRDAFRQLMDAYGLDRYWLRIYPWNEVTINFHKRNGFKIIATVTEGDNHYLIMDRDGRQPWPE